jgi:hypothetical protein
MPLSVGGAQRQRLLWYCWMIMVTEVAVREQGHQISIISSRGTPMRQSAHTDDIAVSPTPVFLVHGGARLRFEGRAVHGGASNEEGGGGFRFSMFLV